VAEHEGTVAQRVSRLSTSPYQIGIGRSRQVTGALDPALAAWVGITPQQEQRQRRRRDTGGQVEVDGHDEILPDER
jgi:hypothetical protein